MSVVALSRTMTWQMDELRIFALRNPVRVLIGGDQCRPTSQTHVEGGDTTVVLPDSLTNHYAVRRPLHGTRGTGGGGRC